jgi:LCP family protein required for cell wall assembly
VKSTRAIRFFTGLSIALVAISAIGAIGLGGLSSQLNRTSVFGGLKNRPHSASSAVNYLVVGSDTREGLTKEQQRALRVGSTKTAAGKRSDTMLLVHISKKRDKAVIVSIPRDTFALIPAHTNASGKLVSESYSKINSSFNWGGAPLLIETLENMTKLRIDHYVEVNFAGFANMVDALGGIEVCSKVAINDPKSHLVMDAGTHILNGIEALKYVRTRDFDGMGDLGRMQRQQQFVSAVLRKATSAGVLLNPIKLVSFINSAMSAVSTDENLNKDDLITLAKQMKNLSASKVRTLTVPLKFYNYNSHGVTSAVLWDPVLAPELFQRLSNDEAIVDTVTPSASPSASPTVVDKFKTRTAAENPCGALK